MTAGTILLKPVQTSSRDVLSRSSFPFHNVVQFRYNSPLTELLNQTTGRTCTSRIPTHAITLDSLAFVEKHGASLATVLAGLLPIELFLQELSHRAPDDLSVSYRRRFEKDNWRIHDEIVRGLSEKNCAAHKEKSCVLRLKKGGHFEHLL